ARGRGQPVADEVACDVVALRLGGLVEAVERRPERRGLPGARAARDDPHARLEEELDGGLLARVEDDVRRGAHAALPIFPSARATFVATSRSASSSSGSTARDPFLRTFPISTSWVS